VGRYVAIRRLRHVARFRFGLLYLFTAQISLEDLQVVGNRLIASIQTHQQPDVGLEFVHGNALPPF